MSVWQTPQAASRTSTSPGPGGARATSCTTSGWANSSRTAARIFMRRTLRDSPQHVVPLHDPEPGGERRTAVGQGSHERAEGLAVAAAKQQAGGVVPARRPLREAQLVDRREVLGERDRPDRVRLAVDPDGALAGVRRVVDALDEVPGDCLAA